MENGIDQKRLEGFLLRFNKVADQVKDKTLRNVNKVNIALGRLISQCPSIARHYKMATKPLYENFTRVALLHLVT